MRFLGAMVGCKLDAKPIGMGRLCRCLGCECLERWVLLHINSTWLPNQVYWELPKDDLTDFQVFEAVGRSAYKLFWSLPLEMVKPTWTAFLGW